MCMNKLYIFIGSFAFLVVLFTSSLYAGLHVDPSVLEIVASDEKPVEQFFKVKNTGEIPIQVRVELKKKKKDDSDISEWFIIETKKIKLDPGEKQEIPYKIVLPEDAEGELRGMVYFIADELGKKKSLIGIRFGVPIYAIAQNTVKLAAEVDKIDVKYDFGKQRLKGIMLVKNKSNIHIRPHIIMRLFDAAGNNVDSFKVPFGQPAQQGQLRPFMFEEKIKLEPGKYKIVASVNYGKMYGREKLIVEGEGEFEVVEVKEEMPQNVTTKNTKTAKKEEREEKKEETKKEAKKNRQD